MSISINRRTCQQAVITNGLLSTPKSPLFGLDNLHSTHKNINQIELNHNKNTDRKNQNPHHTITTKIVLLKKYIKQQ